MARSTEYQQQDTRSLENDFVHTSNPRKECNDVFFLILFLAALIMTVVFAGMYGSDFVDATQIEDFSKDSGVQVLLKYIFYSGLCALGMSLVWMVLMIFAGGFLIWLALLTIIALNLVMAYFFTKQLYDANEKAYWWPAVIFGLCALFTLMYAVCVRKRIKFAAAHLKVAGFAVFRLPMTMVVAFVMVFVQVAWAISWVVGTLGIMFHSNNITVKDGRCTTTQCDLDVKAGAVAGIFFGMLVVFFWGANVIKNVVAVAVAGTVASWKMASNAACITMFAWLRAMTLSLGSICFGSLIVAILEAIQQILNMAASMARSSNNCCAACLLSCISCIVGCIEHWVEFFNRFAYTYVGCYGYSFVTASKHVFQLFASKGWSAIVNDDLTQNVFFLGNLVIGFVSAYIGYSLIKHAEDDDKQALDMFGNPKYVVAGFAFCIGYQINNLLMAVISSAVTTIFVLWAEDPHSWQLTRPDHYETLHRAWLEIYPEEYNNGYGKAGGAHGATQV